MRAELPAQVVELVDAFRNPITQIEFLYLLANAKILEPVLVDAETAARMVRPYSWFLDRVSPEGIKRLHPRRGRLAKPRAPRPTKWQARDTAADTHIMLIRLGALVQARQGPDPEQPTSDGAVFARAALRT